jgi:hypothetical protein
MARRMDRVELDVEMMASLIRKLYAERRKLKGF